MRLPIWRPRPSEVLPGPVRALLGSPGGNVLAVARETTSAAYLIATTTSLYAVSAPDDAPPEIVVRSPWHLVGTGSWSGEAQTLTVTWVEPRPPTRWRIEEAGTFPQVFRERTQASVVLAEEVDLGERRTARVAIRRNLGTGELVNQVILGKGVTAGDAGVMEHCDRVLDALREQVGLG